jgi:hypothetical protein
MIDNSHSDDDREEKRFKKSINTVPSIELTEKPKNAEVDAGTRKEAAEENEVVNQVQGEF